MPSPYHIIKGYKHRLKFNHFDDTKNKDQYQDHVYKAAADIAEGPVLDVGTGSGFKLVKHFKDRPFAGTDLEPTIKWLKKTYQDHRWIVSDFAKPIKEEFDLIICADVIEHLVDPDKLLSWLSKCKWNKLMISTPERDDLVKVGWAKKLGPPKNPAHCREWNTAELRRYMEDWFKVVRHWKEKDKNGLMNQIILVSPSE